MDLTGRHVLVTGGSRGIGAALGARFVAAGARVTLVARDETTLAPVAERIGATALVADVADAPDLIERAETLAPIDVLVHNAGLDATGAFGDLSAQQLRQLYAVNALAPAELTRQALPSMRARRTGRVVFVSSLSAQVTLPGLTAYSATKAAVSQLAEGLRRELRASGVGVTLAEIGPVDTGMWDTIYDYPPAAAAFGRVLATGMLRKLKPEDVSAAVVEACRRDRDSIVLPRRGRLQVTAARIPQRIGNLLTSGQVSESS